jgi:hypothetical protein
MLDSRCEGREWFGQVKEGNGLGRSSSIFRLPSSIEHRAHIITSNTVLATRVVGVPTVRQANG